MNGHLSSILASFTKSPNRRKSVARGRHGLNVECLEGRQLMTASVAPSSLLIYYGYPSLINNANGNLTQAAKTLGQYAYVVLGDTLEFTSHPDHNNAVAILANPAMAHTTVFGYVDLGVTTQDLPMTTTVPGKESVEGDIADWKAMGVKGIFLDDFGYDYDTPRSRQDTAVEYAHSLGLVVIANAFNPADAFGDQVNKTYNPSGTATDLNANDYYLYESYQIEDGSYVTPSAWQSKATQLAAYQSAIGFHVMAVTTNNAANAFSQSEFNYTWYSALLAGYTAVGWGEYDYASDTSAVTSTVPSASPAPGAVGSTFTGTLIESESPAPFTANTPLFTRDTNLGQIQVDTVNDTGSFLATPTFTATPVSGTQINLAWSAVSARLGTW